MKLILLVVFVVAPASADIIRSTVEVEFPADGHQSYSGWSWRDAATIEIDATFLEHDPDTVRITGQATEGYSVLGIAWDVDARVPWTGHEIEIRDPLVDIVGNPSGFASATISTDREHLSFSGGGTTMEWEMLILIWRVGTGGDTSFSITIDHYPTPEPATLSLLAVGALAFRKRRR